MNEQTSAYSFCHLIIVSARQLVTSTEIEHVHVPESFFSNLPQEHYLFLISPVTANGSWKVEVTSLMNECSLAQLPFTSALFTCLGCWNSWGWPSTQSISAWPRGREDSDKEVVRDELEQKGLEWNSVGWQIRRLSWNPRWKYAQYSVLLV